MANTTHPLILDSHRLESALQEIPQESGVYFFKDAHDFLLYIGKSKQLRSRVRSYFREYQNLSPRLSTMVRQITAIEFIVTDTETEALALEANLIKQHQPHFNVLLKDDKKYPYLLITWSEDYPRILITRNRRAGREKDKYYGPYIDTNLLKDTLNLVKRIFPLRQRSQPLFKERPCLNYDLGRCPGVCQQLISPEDYHQIIQKVAMIFQGRISELVDILSTQMIVASEALNFEQAALIRNQIADLKSLTAHQKVSLSDDTISRDAVALATDNQHACIQIFQIRGGKLVGRLGFFADIPSFLPGDSKNEIKNVISREYIKGVAETAAVYQVTKNSHEVLPIYDNRTELATILQQVLEEHYHYADSVEIPKEILVQYELPETEILANVLSERKGRKVNIIAPQRQSKVELIEMVERNAEYELARVQRYNDRNHQALQDLANILDLSVLPHRIEGYDISHIQGTNAVGSQVVFIDGLPAKQHYRHYKIKNPDITIGHSDDFASLAEVITRRFRNCEKINNLPDLLMIDGGKGQLSAVVSVLQEINLFSQVRVISLAKQREEIFLPGESLPLQTDMEQPGVQLLRRLRDEAHRFALSFHRQQRSQQFTKSRLDEISGLGFQRQRQLLAHFRSIDYIRAATPEQLAQVTGIGPLLAQQIYNYFHS